MITYREIAEFFMHLVIDDGKTDVQHHIGTTTYMTDCTTVTPFEVWCEEYFNAKVKKVWGEIKDGQKLLYIYYDKDSLDYAEIAMWHFTTADCAVLDTEDGQKIAVYAIAPEVCVTYKP